MPDTYKLCYFNIRGLGEMLRMIFAEAGVEYEDCRFSSDDWPKHKASMPFGKMPVLYVNGEPLAHSRAIARYLARKFGLEGGDTFTAARLDVWIETLFETLDKLPWTEEDEAKKAEKTAAFMKDTADPKLKKLEAEIAASGGPYVLGEEKFSVLDIIVYTITDLWKCKFDIGMGDYPRITKLQEAVAARKNIAAWFAKRPNSDF